VHVWAPTTRGFLSQLDLTKPSRRRDATGQRLWRPRPRASLAARPRWSLVATLGVTAGLAATAGVFLGLAAAIVVVLTGAGWFVARTRRSNRAAEPAGPTPVAAPLRRRRPES
jgi:hypothetical protein